MKLIQKLRSDSAGATAIEYGMIAAMISLAALGAMQSIGNAVKSPLNKAGTEMAKSN